MAEVTVSGKFVQDFANSAGEVSPVFERKLRKFLAENGIEDISDDGWYPLADFSKAIADVEDVVGEMTARVGGRSAISLVEELDGTQSLAETMEIGKQANEAAYRNFTVEKAGTYDYESTDEGFRLATVGGWQHPKQYTRGLMEGFVENATDYTAEDLEETLSQSDEVFAFLLPK